MYEYETRLLRAKMGEKLWRACKRYGCIVAGGAITSIFTEAPIHDIDIYFRSKESLANMLYESIPYYSSAYTQTAKAITFYNCPTGHDVQCIFFNYFSDAESLLKSFDFTVCMGAFDFQSEDFVLHQDFLKHNAQRKLVFNPATPYPIMTGLRIQKYQSRGYTISNEEYTKFLLTVMNAHISSWEELRFHLSGMYGEDVDAMLHDYSQRPFSMDSAIKALGSYEAIRHHKNEHGDRFPVSIGDPAWDAAVYALTSVPRRCFIFGKAVWSIYGDVCEKNRRVCDCEGGDKRYTMCSIGDIVQFPITRYKYVCKEQDGQFHSFYNQAFKYASDQTVQDTAGIYASTLEDVPTTYAHNKDSVLIELRIDSIEDVVSPDGLISGTGKYRRVFVIGEVPDVSRLASSRYGSFSF